LPLLPSASGSNKCIGWSIREFVRSARGYVTIEIQDRPRRRPHPDDLRNDIDLIHWHSAAR
jgi:hypothetical protein